MQLLDKILTKLRSPKFFWAVAIVFLLQGIFFAVAVNPSHVVTDVNGYESRGGGVVPDGNRHIGAIYYFAEQPILNGPFIDNMDSQELWMGDLEKFPSYLYYYLLSFFVRIPIAFEAPDIVNVMTIRFIGLFIGLLALVVFRKIVQEMKVGETIVNLSTLALAITGSFAWLAPSENYDILALLFFFLFVLASMRLLARGDPRQLYLMALWFFAGGITKYTYIPFMGLFGLVAIALFVKKSRSIKNAWHSIKERYVEQFRAKRWLVVIAVIPLVFFGSLFVERIGGNLLQYQSFNPSCADIHTHEGCRAFGVYERNYNRGDAVESGRVEPINFNPVEYTGFWIYRYYTSMYAYVGHIWIYEFWVLMYAGAAIALVTILTMLAFAKVKRQKILRNQQQKFIGFAVAVLVLAQFLFNMNTYINFAGAAYAHQGRYLLPAIGFVYVLVLLLVAGVIRKINARKKSTLLIILIAVALLAIFTNSALPTFLIHADSSEWYSEFINS